MKVAPDRNTPIRHPSITASLGRALGLARTRNLCQHAFSFTLMCGIIGYIGQAEATPILMDGLRRLEYRGYDSAGIAPVANGAMQIRKRAGGIGSLAELIQKEPPRGHLHPEMPRLCFTDSDGRPAPALCLLSRGAAWLRCR